MRSLNLKKRIILNALGVSRRQNKWGPDRMNSKKQDWNSDIDQSKYKEAEQNGDIIGSWRFRDARKTTDIYRYNGKYYGKDVDGILYEFDSAQEFKSVMHHPDEDEEVFIIGA